MPPGCPVPEDVCSDTAFAEVCSPCARGCPHRDPAIRTDARFSFVLLLWPCAVWVSLCPGASSRRNGKSGLRLERLLCCLCTKSVPFPYTSKRKEPNQKLAKLLIWEEEVRQLPWRTSFFNMLQATSDEENAASVLHIIKSTGRNSPPAWEGLNGKLSPSWIIVDYLGQKHLLIDKR